MSQYNSIVSVIRDEYEHAMGECYCSYCSTPPGFRAINKTISIQRKQNLLIRNNEPIKQCDNCIPEKMSACVISEVKLNSITVSWYTPKLIDGTVPTSKHKIISYELQLTIIDNNLLLKSNEYITVYIGNKLQYTITCVQTGVGYKIRIKAINSVGSSELWSDPITVYTLGDRIQSSDTTPIDHIPILSNIQLREQMKHSNAVQHEQQLVQQRIDQRTERMIRRNEAKQKKLQHELKLQRECQLQQQQLYESEQRKKHEQMLIEQKYEQIKQQIALNLQQQSMSPTNDINNNDMNDSQQQWNTVQHHKSHSKDDVDHTPQHRKNNNNTTNNDKQSRRQRRRIRSRVTKSNDSPHKYTTQQHKQANDNKSIATTTTVSPSLSNMSSTTLLTPLIQPTNTTYIQHSIPELNEIAHITQVNQISGM